jgi:hypothetical protein
MVAEYNALKRGIRVNAIFQGLYEDMETKMLAAARKKFIAFPSV